MTADAIIALELGHYRLREQIAGSAYGIIWRASGPNGTRDVAIKLINQDQMARALPAQRERWTQSAGNEIAFLQSLEPWDERHIVRLLDSGWHEGLPVLALELMGADLGKHMAALKGCGEEVALPQALAWIAQINQALAKVHQYGWRYLDLKPANVLLDQHLNTVKLADFGTNRHLGSLQAHSYAGTANWQAPEQFFPLEGGGYATGARSDYFSLGAMFYFLVTGGLPLRFCSDCGHAYREHHVAGADLLRGMHGGAIPARAAPGRGNALRGGDSARHARRRAGAVARPAEHRPGKTTAPRDPDQPHAQRDSRRPAGARRLQRRRSGARHAPPHRSQRLVFHPGGMMPIATIRKPAPGARLTPRTHHRPAGLLVDAALFLARAAARNVGTAVILAMLAALCGLQALALLRAPAMWQPAAISVRLAAGDSITLGQRELGAPQADRNHLSLRRDANGNWMLRNLSATRQVVLLRGSAEQRMGSVALQDQQRFQIEGAVFEVGFADARSATFTRDGHQWRYDGAVLYRDGHAQAGCPDTHLAARMLTLWNRAMPLALTVARPLSFGGNLYCDNRLGLQQVTPGAAQLARIDGRLQLAAGSPDGDRAAVLATAASQMDLRQQEAALAGVTAIQLGRTRFQLTVSDDQLTLNPGRLLATVGLLSQLELGLGAQPTESSWLRYYQKSAAMLAIGAGVGGLLRLWAKRQARKALTCRRRTLEWMLALFAAARWPRWLLQVAVRRRNRRVRPAAGGIRQARADRPHRPLPRAGARLASGRARGGCCARWLRLAAPALLFLALLAWRWCRSTITRR
jgi:hypothetical protein